MSESHEVTPPTDDDVYNDEKADIVLVSSDNIAFKVHRYYLQAHSSVFRSMILDTSDSEVNKKVELTDTQIEHSSTIRIFLDAVYSKPLALIRDSLGPFRNCIQFARKFDCETLLVVLRALAAQFLDQRISPHYIFIIAAELGDIDLAARTIASKADHGWHWSTDKDIPDPPPRWRTSEESKLEQSGGLGENAGAGVLEVTSWPIWELQRVPLPYVVALMKTGRVYDLSQDAKNGQAASAHFKELMNEWQQQQASC
ncbi:uncharacterized protein I206_102837 [Kwoniella pini CBS 10737]|uniref:BTB domain-containing protein n=1 Tax=Kwoniella pini CBS 10737 TaxID=1296096 RepID=A0A1B9I6H3_9TREE|nr:uncharacterized protein I206_03190 [Kwoniella pini CBS 10737]OCF51124.1 hypothetical protein I206_03190 [Kwoniella pini CBS 10737]